MKRETHDISYILLALVVAILPHLFRLPVWIILWCAGMWGYLLVAVKFNWTLPNQFFRLGLAIVGFLGLLATFPAKIGSDAYLGLLALMAAIKPFEMKTHRDRMVTLFLAYFIVITSLFQSETLPMTVYMFISVWVTTASLIRINDPYGRFAQNLRLSGRIVIQAIPLTVILFLIFPRLQGSLFGIMRTEKSVTGFSDRLSPGSISKLAENNEVAFRAEFIGVMPTPDKLYFRGIVFNDFDGRNWSQGSTSRNSGAPPLGENPVEYTITLEPHGNRFLFALDLPAKIPDTANMQEDFTITSRFSVVRPMVYPMASFMRYHTGILKQWELKALTLPESGNPRTRELARNLTNGVTGTSEKIDRVLAYFQSNAFIYTLEPPVLGKDPVDAFLFESRKGFCEHYASGFAFLMREMGVPARIVGGYLGGEKNPYGDYLIVRQSDAHVWVEVWSAETGWVRVDPTSVVAPERITIGMDQWRFSGQGGDLLFGGYSGPLSGALKELMLGWDMVNSGWSAWFSGYSKIQQHELLEKFGITFGSWWVYIKLILLASVLLGGIILLCVQLMFHQPRRVYDEVAKTFERYCQKLAAAGLARKPDQGPLDYADYVKTNRPDLAIEVDEITNFYIALRFEGKPGEDILKPFKSAVRRFRPKKIHRADS